MLNSPLQLTGTVHIAASADDLYDDLAEALMESALLAVRDRGVFHVALSGGSTPEPFYLRLVTDPRFRAIPWKQAHLWIVDERRVPEDHEKSNYRMIRETLVDAVGLKTRQRHPMPVLASDPAGEYERELRRVFTMAGSTLTGPATDGLVEVPRLDFVLLGMGDDAHTASLFPGSPALAVRDRLIALNDGPAVVPPPRVTMTYPLLNAARNVAVLVVGGKKADTLRRIDTRLRQRGPDPEALPITGVSAPVGELTWYLDAAAAGQ